MDLAQSSQLHGQLCVTDVQHIQTLEHCISDLCVVGFKELADTYEGLHLALTAQHCSWR